MVVITYLGGKGNFEFLLYFAIYSSFMSALSMFTCKLLLIILMRVIKIVLITIVIAIAIPIMAIWVCIEILWEVDNEILPQNRNVGLNLRVRNFEEN